MPSTPWQQPPLLLPRHLAPRLQPRIDGASETGVRCKPGRSEMVSRRMAEWTSVSNLAEPPAFINPQSIPRSSLRAHSHLLAKQGLAIEEKAALEMLPCEHERKPDVVVDPHSVIRNLRERDP
jgi:hypothetical protein